MTASAHERAWERIRTALRARSALSGDTAREIAEHADQKLGADLVRRFVDGYYLPHRYGYGVSTLSDKQAAALVAEVETLARGGAETRQKASRGRPPRLTEPARENNEPAIETTPTGDQPPSHSLHEVRADRQPEAPITVYPPNARKATLGSTQSSQIDRNRPVNPKKLLPSRDWSLFADFVPVAVLAAGALLIWMLRNLHPPAVVPPDNPARPPLFVKPDEHGPPPPSKAPVKAPRLSRPTVITNPVWLHKPSGDEVDAVYPERAQRMGVSGRAELACFVTETGGVSDCSVVQEDPYDQGFGAAALKIAHLFKMRPQTKNGQPVGGARVNIPIRFQMGD